MLTTKLLGIVLLTWFLISPVVATVVGRALKAADREVRALAHADGVRQAGQPPRLSLVR